MLFTEITVRDKTVLFLKVKEVIVSVLLTEITFKGTTVLLPKVTEVIVCC